MFASTRSAAARVTRRLFDPAASELERRLEFCASDLTEHEGTAKGLYAHYRSLVAEPERLPRYGETGLRVFSQFEEDGIILFVLATAGISRFVVESDEESVERGRSVYGSHDDTRLFPPVFVDSVATRENILGVLSESGFDQAVDVLSIDIDDNDYFIWEALESVRPRLVVIETHTEHGIRDVLVPYRADYDWRKADPAGPIGASPAAMTRLADKLGYRLVGANRFAFNTFYLRRDLAPSTLPTIELGEILRHDRNRSR